MSAASPRMPPDFPPAWASAWGDDVYGLWAAFEVRGVVQRMRWIEPGEFAMGSPKNEKGRFDDEGPQHTVKLTHGYWIADTACTQAMWQAVMGLNPSYVQDDPQKPVENAQWIVVEDFLEALPGLDGLPSTMQVTLPTEAEWEYACRAGTTTAYHSGETISLATVNCDHKGNWELRLKAKHTTMPVKYFEPNAWGLYQMHGNVWEWCSDDLRQYGPVGEHNPKGETYFSVEKRAVRGGSWRYAANLARSARRGRRKVTVSFDDVGFRLAIRPMDRIPY